MGTWVQHVRKHQSELALLMAVESGKHLDESTADVVEAIHMLQYCAGRGRQPIGERVASEIPDKEAEIYLAPRGVCTVITPWNFPAAIPTWLIGPALVCGNPVVFKPSEETPLTAQYLVRLFDLAAREHGAPPGVLSLVYGPGPVGEHLVRHPDTVGQLFTINLPTIGAEVHLPFGGMKRSGTGNAVGGLAVQLHVPRHRLHRQLRRGDQDGPGPLRRGLTGGGSAPDRRVARQQERGPVSVDSPQGE